MNLPTLAQGRGPLDDVLQFPHIAGEAVLLQGLQGRRLDAGRGAPGTSCSLGAEMGRQRSDILPAFPQGRHPQFYDIDAVVQVIAEASAVHQFLQGLVGGAQYTHIHGYLGAPPHRSYAAFLQGSQQFDLHGHGQLGDLIQKQGASGGGLKQPLPILLSPGKTALDMAKQFALYQFCRDRATVDRHEGLACPGPAQVQIAGQQFLAGAGFPAQVHRHLTASQFVQLGQQPVHGRAVADQRCCTHGGWGMAELSGAVDQVAQLLQCHGFGQEIKGPGLQCADRRFHAAVGGQYRDRQLWMMPLHILNHGDTIPVRQAHIGQAQRKAFPLQGAFALRQTGSRSAVRIHPGQAELQHVPHIRFVINDQYVHTSSPP